MALVLLILGVVVGTPPAIVMIVRGVSTLTTHSMRTPGVEQRHLGSGKWFVFQRTGTKTGVGGITVTHQNAPTLRPADVTVVAPDGARVPVSYVTVNETITRDTQIYTAVVQFKVSAPGTYTVSVATPDSQVIVTRSLGQTFRGFVWPAVITAVGGLLTLVGIVLLVVGSVRRNRAAAIPAYASGGFSTPPGWYPDPSAPQRLRWWDGTRWTDYSS